MNLTRSQKIILGAIAAAVLLLFGIFSGVIPGLKKDVVKAPEIELNVWGISDSLDFETNFAGYRQFRSNVDINYKQIDARDYEDVLLNALAAGTGPDIFMVHNTWLPKHFNKLVAANNEQITLDQIKSLFPTVVEQDFAPDQLIYGLPLFVDTLALYYNQDIFDASGVAIIPSTWEEFQTAIPKLRQIDGKTNKIIRAGAAIGGDLNSIGTATDILYLLMLQNGTKLVDDNFTRANFSDRANYAPGLEALNFYTKFADPRSIYYTWDGKSDAVDSFAQGKTAAMFNYAFQKERIKNKNILLNFNIAPMPQIDPKQTAINYADYWGLVVSNKSVNPNWAWDLILYLTTNEASAENYLKLTGYPPALKTLVDKYIKDPNLGIFAKQALSSRSWPQIDSEAIANIFSEMIKSVNEKKLSSQAAIDQAELQVTDLMIKNRP
ncbi:MAG: extracellular solute-binding protein [Candidatus Pacebacteria bacterium]|nr:extracellular solute-binding protein [Candidatus Paceibacterota bacterium]